MFLAEVGMIQYNLLVFPRVGGDNFLSSFVSIIIKGTP